VLVGSTTKSMMEVNFAQAPPMRFHRFPVVCRAGPEALMTDRLLHQKGKTWVAGQLHIESQFGIKMYNINIFVKRISQTFLNSIDILPLTLYFISRKGSGKS
jgi:hypothetical protein